MTHSGWKRLLVFFILVILLNAFIKDAMGTFALALFISIIIGLLIAGGKKHEKPRVHRTRK